MLKISNLRPHTLVAPFICILTVVRVLLILKDVDTAHVKLAPDHLQYGIDCCIRIGGFIKYPEHILKQAELHIALCLLIRIYPGIGRTAGLLGELL